MKRIFDLLISVSFIILISPILAFSMITIYLQDLKSPFYIAPRVGKNGNIFKMIKLRTMIVGANKAGVDSTSSLDHRITSVGRWIRRLKLDEFAQFLNVVIGDMSVVGPRPQVLRDVALYTEKEKNLLKVKPGITDISSLVFSDEGDILKKYEDPDLAYNQLIRPWKSRLGLIYIDNQSFYLDIVLLFLTAVSVFSRKLALRGVQRILKRLQADSIVIEIARKRAPLIPYHPPGAKEIVTSR